MTQRPILILGGGVNGAAAARELVLNGMPVVLVDTADLAYGATAYSSRLIHGGLRYLEYGEFALVRESLEERARLLKLAPHLVHPLRLFIPVRTRWTGFTSAAAKFLGLKASPQDRGLFLVRTGLWKLLDGGICGEDDIECFARAVPLVARTASSVVEGIANLAASSGLLWDAPRMADAIRARESMHPTALDNGVAFLHPRRPLPQILAQPLLALGRTNQGIPFGNSSGQLTDVFFLICSTDDAGHLHTLARLSRIVSLPNFLADLRSADGSREALDIVLAADAAIEQLPATRSSHQ